ncbi:MAG: family 16 glycosylhydrolase [Bacteroidales bacterium]|nr:family 16 glycosylhydrolase [Bacteroidales bacterium]MBN2821219.1 family 16 glycosylhydrolase [Bacteroidales bacterium]
MAGLKTLLGLFPKTSVYEQKRKELEDEYKALGDFESSDELTRYRELEKYVNSEEFTKQKNELLSLKYKDSEEYKKEQEYKQLKKDSSLKLYYKTLSSAALKSYNETKASDKPENYKSLEQYLQSDEYNKVKLYYKTPGKKRFEQSEPGKKLFEYQKLKNSQQFKAYLKFTSDKLFPAFKELDNSDTIKRYEELKKITSSAEFAKKKSSMKKAEFQESDEGKQLLEYTTLAKSKNIKAYNKLKNSAIYTHYQKLEGSKELSVYTELETYILSEEFKSEKNKIEKAKFESTAEFKKLKDFEALQKDADIKHYFKFGKSKELANYNNISNSDKLLKFEALSEYIKTEEFLEKKKYLELKPVTRWQQSEVYKQLAEFEKLKKSEKIVWYFKTRGHKKFDWIQNWSVTFEDDFDKGSVDSKKWLTKYYWGEETIGDTYSLENEKHFISEGKNLELNGTVLKIVTKSEKNMGKAWTMEHGFIPREYNYSSGIINSGKSFRQKYGYFEAKIKFAKNSNLINAFWMVGEQNTPHINVVEATNKCNFGIRYDDNVKIKKSISRSRYSADFHVFSLEWDENTIVWRINGLDVKTIKGKVPSEEMYLNLSAGLYKETNLGLPDSMEIDWVRCYQKNN